jgi:hypothetical protein
MSTELRRFRILPESGIAQGCLKVKPGPVPAPVGVTGCIDNQ